MRVPHVVRRANHVSRSLRCLRPDLRARSLGRVFIQLRDNRIKCEKANHAAFGGYDATYEELGKSQRNRGGLLNFVGADCEDALAILGRSQRSAWGVARACRHLAIMPRSGCSSPAWTIDPTASERATSRITTPFCPMEYPSDSALASFANTPIVRM